MTRNTTKECSDSSSTIVVWKKTTVMFLELFWRKKPNDDNHTKHIRIIFQFTSYNLRCRHFSTFNKKFFTKKCTSVFFLWKKREKICQPNGNANKMAVFQQKQYQHYNMQRNWIPMLFFFIIKNMINNHRTCCVCVCLCMHFTFQRKFQSIGKWKICMSHELGYITFQKRRFAS